MSEGTAATTNVPSASAQRPAVACQSSGGRRPGPRKRYDVILRNVVKRVAAGEGRDAKGRLQWWPIAKFDTRGGARRAYRRTIQRTVKEADGEFDGFMFRAEMAENGGNSSVLYAKPPVRPVGEAAED